MLFPEKSASEKRADFKKALSSGKLLRFPGAFAPYISRMIEEAGFDGIYVSGAVLSADLALPDIGLTTLPEVIGRGRQIARVTKLPTIIDVDTGFGEPMNAVRTIMELEENGLAGCHLEDQVNPKRCGHLDNKTLISTKEMCEKLKAAVSSKRDENFIICARTDARGVDGIDAAIERAKAYVDCGVDMIFPEALKEESEYEQFRKAVDVPLLANLTEFGKTPLLTKQQLENLGWNLAIYPVTTWRLACDAVEKGLETIFEQGTQSSLLDKMQTRARLYEYLQYDRYNQFDKDVFNFKLEEK